MARTVDLLIIGAGSAGLNAAKEARRWTSDFLLVDPGPWGTTCARVGCMPSKVLLHVAHEVATTRATLAGPHAAGHLDAVDTKAVMARVRELRDRFAAGPKATVERYGEHVIAAPARFTAPDTVVAGGEPIRARRIIVATGSHPVVPGPWRELGDALVTSDEVFELDTLPGRVGVVGLGAIGSELGQALARLGVDVHVFAKDRRVGTLADPVANAAATAALSREMALHTGHAVDPARLDTGGVAVGFGEQRYEVDKLLVAMGRAPNVAGLNLDALGLRLDRAGLPPIDPATLRAGDTPVHFAGDVTMRHPLLHEAADDGRLAAYAALAPDPACLRRRTPLAIVFTDPGIARVGCAHDALPDDALVSEIDYSRQGRGIVTGVTHGVARLYATRHGDLLGAELVVPQAEHLAHQLAWMIQMGGTVTEMLQLPFYHPVLEEGLRTALQDVRRRAGRAAGPDLPLCGGTDDPVPGC